MPSRKSFNLAKRIMASDTKLPSMDWLSMFQQNWIKSEHFEIYNRDGEDVLWLLADPFLDPFEVEEAEQLILLLYRPRREIPQDRFTARVNGDIIRFSGTLDGNAVELIFTPSVQNPSRLRGGLEDIVWLDISKTIPDYFFKRFTYGDVTMMYGTKVLYDDDIWCFIHWYEGNRARLECFTEDDEVIVKHPLVDQCLRVCKARPRCRPVRRDPR